MKDQPADPLSVRARPTVAVVGCGRWGRHVVRDLVTLDCTVVVVDVSVQGRQLGEQLGARACVAALDEAVRDFDIDGFVIAAPTSQHAPLAVEALAVGVPVFVEKPLTDDPALAAEMVAAGPDLLFVMHKWHYHPGVEALAELAASGELGRVNGVTSERTGPANPSNDTDAIWLLAPHEITIGQRILGSFPSSTVAVADLADHGVVGVDAIARWDDARWHRWSVSVRTAPARRHVMVHGTHGFGVLADPYAAHIEVHRDAAGSGSASVDRVPISQEFPLIRQLRSFRDHLLGGPPPPTSGSDGVAVVQIIASLRSAAGLPATGSLLADPARPAATSPCADAG